MFTRYIFHTFIRERVSKKTLEGDETDFSLAMESLGNSTLPPTGGRGDAWRVVLSLGSLQTVVIIKKGDKKRLDCLSLLFFWQKNAVSPTLVLPQVLFPEIPKDANPEPSHVFVLCLESRTEPRRQSCKMKSWHSCSYVTCYTSLAKQAILPTNRMQTECSFSLEGSKSPSPGRDRNWRWRGLTWWCNLLVLATRSGWQWILSHINIIT